MLLRTTTVATTGSAHLLVISLVLRQDLLPHLLLPLMDIRIKLIAVLLDRELLVVIDRDEDFLSANWFLLWVVELLDIRVLQSLLSRQSLVRIKLKQILQKVKSVFRCGWEHVAKFLGLRWR